MPLTISQATVDDSEQLRSLLIENAEQLAGDGASLVEARLAQEGYPLLLVDAQLHPVVISFDTDSGDKALLDGLQATHHLSVSLSWLNQAYPKLQSAHRDVKLVVVARKLPAAARLLFSDCSRLNMFRYRVVRVNTQAALWLESIKTGASVPGKAAHGDSTRRKPTPRLVTVTDNLTKNALPELTDKEKLYFRQL